MVTTLLAATDLTYAIHERILVRPSSLSFEKGRVYGLIGHNGSGKSTLLKLLARQLVPTGGSVSLEGKPVKHWSSRAFARKVAYLPQQPPSATGMTVRELVGLGRYPWHGAIGRFTANDRERVGEAMLATEVDGFADRLVDSLSGGERQRAWLAMLVAQGADCMLLDEPTSALDIAHQLQILDLIRKIASGGPGVVIVLHDINMAARFCDELIALHSGGIIHRGSARETMTTDALETIYNVRMAVLPHPENGGPIGIAL